MLRQRPPLFPLLSLFVLVGLLTNAGAEHFPPAVDLLELIRTRGEEGRGTGIVVGVLEADGTRRIQAFGTAGPGALPLDAETIFEIGSISKVFTGIILADMASEGLITIEDPLQDHVPDGVTVPNRPAETVFFLKVVKAQVELVVEEGAVAALILHQNGASQRASKVDAP
jgi:CubicO group peptidase (beta-lactamase class C family)